MNSDWLGSEKLTENFPSWKHNGLSLNGLEVRTIPVYGCLAFQVKQEFKM